MILAELAASSSAASASSASSRLGRRVPIIAGTLKLLCFLILHAVAAREAVAHLLGKAATGALDFVALKLPLDLFLFELALVLLSPLAGAGYASCLGPALIFGAFR